MNENALVTLESGSEDEALNLLKDFNVKVWHTATSLYMVPGGPISVRFLYKTVKCIGRFYQADGPVGAGLITWQAR